MVPTSLYPYLKKGCQQRLIQLPARTHNSLQHEHKPKLNSIATCLLLTRGAQLVVTHCPECTEAPNIMAPKLAGEYFQNNHDNLLEDAGMSALDWQSKVDLPSTSGVESIEDDPKTMALGTSLMQRSCIINSTLIPR